MYSDFKDCVEEDKMIIKSSDSKINNSYIFNTPHKV